MKKTLILAAAVLLGPAAVAAVALAAVPVIVLDPVSGVVAGTTLSAAAGGEDTSPSISASSSASPGSPAPAGGGATAVEYALAQLGTPYRWGGEQAGVGFDCSGLAQAAWAAAGVAIPRVAADQQAAGPAVAPGALAPGDLVFFGPAPGAPATHVGIVVDPAGVMVDAPHTGADVRVEPFPTVPGEAWGDDVYEGATAPGG
jgi:cell wall-associated NlpC family hydrolase